MEKNEAEKNVERRLERRGAKREVQRENIRAIILNHSYKSGAERRIGISK